MEGKEIDGKGNDDSDGDGEGVFEDGAVGIAVPGKPRKFIG